MKPEEQRALPVREPGIEIAAIPRLDDDKQQRTDCRLVASLLVPAAGVAGGRHVGGLRHADELECEVAVRRSADGVADQPGERRMDRHRGTGRHRD
jgi:hypothetical protein